jgi:hypothetical protein
MTDRATVESAMGVQDVADALKVSRVHIHRLTQLLDLPYARQVGRAWIYWPEDVAVIAARLHTTGITDGR